MKILGIESSCDETAAAIVDEHSFVYADVIASQIEMHAEYGGVVPELASRAHLANVRKVVDEALAQAAVSLDEIDAIAATNGPGLIGSLLIGLQFAKSLAWSRNLPLVGVDHLAGHLFAYELRRSPKEVGAPQLESPIGFGEKPFIALLASGGHTAIYEVRDVSDYDLLGQTRDDAAGEAFDKAAKVLQLGYPGGPIVDRLAKTGDASKIQFSMPFNQRKTCDFSFSGLKTALATRIETFGLPTNDQELADLCASYQEAIVETMVRKAFFACREQKIPRLVLAGGVAANGRLRELAQERAKKAGVELLLPERVNCTDNAAMIANVGAKLFARGERSSLELAAYSKSPSVKRGKFARERTAIAKHKAVIAKPEEGS